MSSLGVVGCSSETETTNSTPDPKVAAIDIGPEGGELVGTEENGFPGVKLVIPEGALSEEIRVSFDGAFDTTALPTLAERVGPQVRILPEGTALAVPAQLTLPTEHELRLAYEDQDQDCKVWAREGEAWSRKEPIATGEGSVTVEIAAFTTAAAGVVLAPKPAFCAACSPPSVLIDVPCQSSIGYCVSAVREPGIPLGSFVSDATVFADKLYYLQVADKKVNPVEYEIFTSAAATAFNSHSFSQGNNFRSMSVSGEGSVWLPIVNNGGTVKFRKNSLPELFDSGLSVEGVVAGATDAEVTRVIGTTKSSQRSYAAKSFKASTTLTSVSTSTSVAVLPFGGVGRFFMAISSAGTCLGSAIASQTNCSPSADSNPLNGRRSGAIAVSAQESAVANTSFESTRVLAVLGPSGRGPVLRSYTPPNAVASMAFGDDNNIYAVNTSRAEVMILSPSGGVSTLTLSTDDVASDAYIAMLPRKILNLPGRDELLLIVKGDANGQKRLFRIRKP